MFEKQISQSLQDAIKKITSVSEALVGNQHRIDKNKNGKIDAHDFKLLKGQKAAPMKEDPDWVIIEQDEDNTTAEVAGHKVTLHRSLSEPGSSDTYTLHHPSGDKKVKISYDTHGNGEEVHGDKVNKAFGLDSKHKLGHKIAGSMNGMGGISKFEESVEQNNEAMSHQAKTTMKHIPNASPALKKAAKDIKPGIAGYRDRIAMLKAGGVKEEVVVIDELSKATLGSYAKKATRDSTITRKIASDFEHMSDRARTPGMKQAAGSNAQRYKEKSWKRRDGVDKAVDRLTKEEVEEQVDETIVKHDSFTVEIKESYSFADYLTAAKQLVGEEEAVAYANEAFKTQDLTIFIMEEMSRGDIEDNVNAHRKAGHTVTMPKYSTKDGKPYAEYMVTDKNEGTRRKYIHHGNVRKVENMGAKG